MKGRRSYGHPEAMQAGGVIRVVTYRVRRLTMNGCGLPVFLAAAVAYSILARFYERFPGDVSLILWVRSWQHPATTTFMQAMTVIGKSFILIGLAGATALGLFLARRQQEGFAATGTLGLLLLTPILQILVDRPRPPADLVGLDHALGGFGFPSGHAYQSFVLFGFLVYLATILISRTWLRRLIQVILILLILAIGISRLYFGAHWPSDVLGAYLLAGACLALLLRGFQFKAATVPSR